MESKERRLWLIDGAYMYRSQSSADPQYRFDYKKLREKLEQEGKFFQVYYLNSVPKEPPEAMEKFHTWLKSAPPQGPQFQVKLFDLRPLSLTCPACGVEFQRHVQKGVDVGIATLALTLADRYDTLVLSTGDGDFKDMVEYVRNTLNKRVELVVFKSGVSTDLQSLADRVRWIDEFKHEVEKI